MKLGTKSVMKQSIIELKKKLLLVEFEHFDSIRMANENNILYKGKKIIKIGKLTDITEEQFGQWVFRSKIGTYKDYNYDESKPKIDEVGLMNALLEMKFKTAKESFFSALEANGIYLKSKNTLDKPNKDDYHFGFVYNESDLYIKHFKIWKEAQEKVWDIERCWLFEIIP